jgi:hypothetical protein
MSGHAAIVLAGGDGTRLAALTRRLAGDDRPKQFCRLIGDETLLEQTHRRANLLVEPGRLVTIVRLAVLPASGVGWSDLGDPARVRAVQEQIGGELVAT